MKNEDVIADNQGDKPHLVNLLENNDLPGLRHVLLKLIYEKGYTYDQIYIVFNDAQPLTREDFDSLMSKFNF